MNLHVIAIGDRMPEWVNEACAEYSKRIRGQYRLFITEVAAGRRGSKGSVDRAIKMEGARQLEAVPKSARIIALERTGKEITTRALAGAMRSWLMQGRDCALLLGGPEGLSKDCLTCADEVWSLSDLTLAHPVARIVLVEQLYRAWAIINNLPYHR